jgi:hypothetical protein
MLFSVVAEDWPMIGHCFMRDPGEPARTLLGILEHYDDGLLQDDDPELARQAFREILDSIRPQARQRLTDEFSAAVEFAQAQRL